MSLELRVVGDTPAANGAQQWGSSVAQEEEWQKVTVANGEKARFEFGTAQAWGWTHTAVRGNGTGSVDGVGQHLQWAQDVRSLECQVAWAGGAKPARLEVSVQANSGGKGTVDGVLPQPVSSKVQTVVLVPLGEWFTLARSGPRPQQQVEGATAAEARRLAKHACCRFGCWPRTEYLNGSVAVLGRQKCECGAGVGQTRRQYAGYVAVNVLRGFTAGIDNRLLQLQRHGRCKRRHGGATAFLSHQGHFPHALARSQAGELDALALVQAGDGYLTREQHKKITGTLPLLKQIVPSLQMHAFGTR